MSTARHELLRVIVGSQAHGLAGPDSDTDYRGVYVIPTASLLSLGHQYKGAHWLEGESEDQTAYELGHFLKLALQCNPTILEVCLARIVSTTPWGTRLRALFPVLIDPGKAYAAFVNYADHQRKKFLENTEGRAHKFAAAYIRVHYQLVELLETGTFQVCMTGSPFEGLLRRCRAGRYTCGEIIDVGMSLQRRAELALTRHPWPGQNADQVNQLLLEIRRTFWTLPPASPQLRCALCDQLVEAETAHLHQGQWIGDDCCWDERLRASE